MHLHYKYMKKVKLIICFKCSLVYKFVTFFKAFRKEGFMKWKNTGKVSL